MTEQEQAEQLGNLQQLVVPPGYGAEDFEERGTGEQLAALYGALAAAQGEFGEIIKDRHVEIRKKDGGQYSYDYAPLCNVVAATMPALSKHGLAVLQPPTRLMREGDKAIVRTILAHKDGGRLVFVMEIRGEGDIKDFGGRITYARRYQLQAVLGVDGGEADDDAAPTRASDASASAAPRNRTPPQPTQQAQKPPARERPQAAKPAEPKPQEPTPTTQAQLPPAEVERRLTTAEPAAPPSNGAAPEPQSEPAGEHFEGAPLDIQTMSDAELGAEIKRVALEDLKHSQTSAQRRCIEVTGKPRQELGRADMERLLVAFRADALRAQQPEVSA